MKQKQVQGSCIFCSRTGLTKQHVWPRWMESSIPKNGDTHKFTGNIVIRSGSLISRTPTLMNLQGHVGSKKLREVCSACNSGWMSDIEQDVKSILLSLIRGENITLTPEDQAIICDWAMMITMVAEFTDRATISIPYGDRNNLFNDNFPEGWEIFLGKYNGNEWKQRYFHTGGHIQSMYSRTQIFNPIYDSQTSTFVVGSLFLYVRSTQIPGFMFPCNVNPTDYLERIYPLNEKNIDLSKKPLITDKEAAIINDSFKDFFETMMGNN